MASTVADAATAAASHVGDALPDTDQAKRQARHVASVAQENPIGLAVGSIAVGFLAGMLVPTTRVEDEKIGPVAEQVREQVKETGQEALQHGKEVAQQAAETAKDAGREHAEQLRDSAQERAQHVTS